MNRTKETFWSKLRELWMIRQRCNQIKKNKNLREKSLVELEQDLQKIRDWHTIYNG